VEELDRLFDGSPVHRVPAFRLGVAGHHGRASIARAGPPAPTL